MLDTLIQNCKIIDGTNSPWFNGDVAIKDGKIVKVGQVNAEVTPAANIVDAHGLFLAPGFIDIHSHSDTSILVYPKAESRVFQGITTEIGGNCGLSVAPVSNEKQKKEELIAYVGPLHYNGSRISDFLNQVESHPISVNFGTAVGHGSIRIAAMGFENRTSTPEELSHMKSLLKESLDDGAFAMSSGLIYPPGCYADISELIELSKVLAQYGSIYMTHMRNEGTKVVDSVIEAIDIGMQSGASVQISHHKIISKSHWKKACRMTTDLIEHAREKGIDITVDQYPYCASSTTLDSNVPEWAFEGGMKALFKRLNDPKTREILKQQCNENHLGRWQDIFIGYVGSEKNQWMVGKSIDNLSIKMNKDPADVCFDLILEEKGAVDEINFGMCEDDIEYIMQKPYVMIGSDGKSISFNYRGNPHPRFFGTFPRIIAHYCKNRDLFPIETAINKMTGLPASRLGLFDRGLIKEGMYADLVLFDLANICDTPSYTNSKQICSGISQVYVNGILTVKDGHHTGATAGKVLRKEY